MLADFWQRIASLSYHRGIIVLLIMRDLTDIADGHDGGGIEYKYQASIIAKLLHALPHYNLTLHRTNSTFRPRNAVYLEVGGFVAVFVFVLDLE